MANHSSNLLWERFWWRPYGFCGEGGVANLFSALQGFKWSQRVICQNNHSTSVKWVKLYYRKVDGTHQRLVWEGDEIVVISESNRGREVRARPLPWSGSRPNREFLRPKRMLKVLPAEVVLLG